MESILNLEVKNFRVIKSTKVSLARGINLLYGFNSGGKSTIINALLTVAGIKDADDEAEITATNNSSYIKYSNREYYCKFADTKRNVNFDLKGDISNVKPCIQQFWENIGIKTIGHMNFDTIEVYNIAEPEPKVLTLNIWNQEQWKELTSNPHTFYEILCDIRDATNIKYLHSGYARIGDNWIPIEKLGYGKRKAIAMLLAYKYADLIVIEGYEAGLHVDLAIYMLSKLSDKNVIIETHMGILLAEALERGWKTYFIHEGEAKEVTKENVFNLGIISKEVKAYSLARSI